MAGPLPLNQAICGDCQTVLSKFPDNCIDLIVTSPPYANSRTKTYGGPHPDEYVDWILPKTKEFLRVLKPTGTFVLNIKEKAVAGERHTYVLDLIVKMREQGWLWTEEFVWTKTNCHPGKWPNRFRDSWERCLQFNKKRKFNMYQDAVMVPMGNWTEKRLKKLSDADHTRTGSTVGSGFGKNVSHWVGRTHAYPSNVLNFATECSNVHHSAAFPTKLPDWFIRVFTVEGDVVLDPFSGSGTTGVAAKSLKRNYVLIDIMPAYIELAKSRIQNGTY